MFGTNGADSAKYPNLNMTVATDLPQSEGQATSDPFLNLLLLKKYLVRSYYSQGSYGKFYKAVDMENGNHEVLLKISKDLSMNKQEYEILKVLNSNT